MCGILFVEGQRDDLDFAELLALLRPRGPDYAACQTVPAGQMGATTLHLRGDAPLALPADGSVLLWNGEVFEGDALAVPAGENDGAVVLAALEACATAEDAAAALDALAGPWAAILWHAPSQSLVFGRDWLGRRSLLSASAEEPGGFALASQALPGFSDWTPVPVDRLFIRGTRENQDVPRRNRFPLARGPPVPDPEARLAACLREAVRRRVAPGDTAVLFSGGVDSTVLALLAADCCPDVQLVTVCFDEKGGFQSPDRRAARAAVAELRELRPDCRWRLTAVDVTAAALAAAEPAIRALVEPRLGASAMELTIGAALWFAARGAGPARVLLSGLGADELLAGYGRHRAAFERGGEAAVADELAAEVGRLWLRNLGRDDRVMSAHGREPRFPFLDADVVALLGALPVAQLADLARPRGEGEKLLLRAVARALGLRRPAGHPKQAIQFGSRSSRAVRQ